jgi:hypothetical protein
VFTPVAILLVLWALLIKEPNRKLAIIVFIILSGVTLASHGELRFNLIGFLIQAAAIDVRPVFFFVFFVLSLLLFISSVMLNDWTPSRTT